MSARILVRLALALAVLVFVWGALSILRRPSPDDPGGLPLAAVSRADIRQVAVRGLADSVVVEGQGSRWRVNGLPAAATMIDQLVAALNDSVARSELVAERAESHERLGVDSAHGRRMTISAGGEPILDLWLGRRGPDFEGFYARQAGATQVYLLRGAFAELTASTVEQWRDREVARLPADAIGRVEVTRGRSRWAVERTAGGWKLAAGAADSARVARFVYQFGDVRAAGFPDSSVPAPDFGQSERAVTVRDRSGGLLLELALDSTAAGAFWARRGSDGVVFRLDGRVVDLLAPEEKSLRP